MPLALAQRDIMVALVIALVIIGFIHFIWPLWMEYQIEKNPAVGGEQFGRKTSLVWIASVFIICASLIQFGKWGMLDPEPGITAILATAAIMFGYPRLFSSPFVPAFEKQDRKPTLCLPVQVGEETAVKLVVRNTSIASWGQFQISLEPYDENAGITFSKNPMGRNLILMNGDTLVQGRFNLLAPGEPALMFFNIKAEREDTFRLRVRVTAEGRPGESHDIRLRLVVQDAKPQTE